jgi:hypothetical protein
VTVGGFKSISEEQSAEIRPLTLLAGANSSGKSSLLQPLLLLKQTLEAPYDPGPLLLNGPNVKFTSTDQLLSRTGKRQSLGTFQVGMRLSTGDQFYTSFRKEHVMGFRVEEMDIAGPRGKLEFWPEMTEAEIVNTGITKGIDHAESSALIGYTQGQWQITPYRCFLVPVWLAKRSDGATLFHPARHGTIWGEFIPPAVWEDIIPAVIHLPGLRGNPERTYPVTAVGPTFPGTFERYTASMISRGASDKKEELLAALSDDLKRLRLTGGVSTRLLNDVQIELHVGRLPDVAPTRPEDRVNIADVGVGISQTLPVLVALHAAAPGQLVYIEQPETHLHPRAQFALAQVLADAAKRGVRVVAETHSSILLLGVQALVAQGKLAPDLVKLHWFMRKKDGSTTIQSGDLDEAGRFGDWPEDFDDVSLEAQKAYLDAADKRLFAQ